MNRVKYDEGILLGFAIALLGIFLRALTFNIFFKPFNLVTSGVSGISLIVNYFTNMDTSLFILIANVGLIILSLVALGFNDSFRAVLGTILYTMFVYLTVNTNAVLNIHFQDYIMYVIVGGILYGVSAGLIYKTGYSSGGTDILTLILAKYSKKEIGKSQLIINVIIVLCGGLIFGLTMVIYAVLVNYIESIIIDKIQLGLSTSKMFYIRTEKPNEVKEYITKVMHSGVTILDCVGGFSNKKEKLLMCTISTKRYIELKEIIKAIDDDAFIVVSDCYEVLGGTKS